MSPRAIGLSLLVLGTLPVGWGWAGSSAAEPGRAGSAGMTVALPAGWHSTGPADGNVIDPLTRIAVSSGPLQARDVPCQIARYAPSPKGVSLVVVEWKRSDGRRGRRPPRFTWRSLPLQRAPALACHDGPGGSVHFQDRGRLVGAYVLLGRAAPQALADAARRVLGTLVVEAAANDGREAELQAEPDALFESQNESKGATSIPATDLRVTVTV